MALELTFEIEGETELARKLVGVSEDLKNWYPEFRKTGELLLKTFRDNFDTQGKELGVMWQPLSESTIAEKKRLGYPLTPLIRSGLMRRSFQSDPGNKQVIVFNPMDYFQYHQSRQARTHIPRRIMMKIDEKRKQLIVKIFQKSIEDTLQKRGLQTTV